MSAMTATPVTHTVDGRALAVALGVVRSTVPALPLPPMTARIVPGRSPLEASGWATDGDALAVLR